MRCDVIPDYGGMRLTCLFEEGYVADTATVSDAIDDQKTVMLLPFLSFGRAGEVGGYL